MAEKFQMIKKYEFDRKGKREETLQRVKFGGEKFVILHQGEAWAKILPPSGRERIRKPRSA